MVGQTTLTRVARLITLATTLVANSSKSSLYLVAMGNNRIGKDQTRSFEDLGYAGPFDLIDIPDASGLAKALNRAKSRMFFWHRVLSRVPLMKTCFPISRWGAAKSKKGIHAVYGEAYRLGSNRRVVDRVTQVLGPDVLLCSSIVINQRPGASHYWHYDIEARDWNGLTVRVALANVSRKSTLQIITRSHRIPSDPEYR